MSVREMQSRKGQAMKPRITRRSIFQAASCCGGTIMKLSGVGTVCLLSLSVAFTSASPGSAADRNPGYLKMALVNMRCLGSHGADSSANQAAVRQNLDRHL
jgi:hypothetical protein